jgi:hypothetical protein
MATKILAPADAAVARGERTAVPAVDDVSAR